MDTTFSGFGECLPNHENYVELDKTKVDAWGVPVLRISCVWRENERALLKDMSITAAEMLSAAGARDIEPFIEDNAPGLTIHEMGTARMGRDPGELYGRRILCPRGGSVGRGDDYRGFSRRPIEARAG